ncbi:MAG: DUF485 domain-containing protein [Alphaproteobacteria bacterium]
MQNNKDVKLDKLIFFSNLISYTLSFIVLVIYLSFIIILGFKPEIFEKFILNTKITYGIFAGLSIIVISILLTLVYVIISNFFLDKFKK